MTLSKSGYVENGNIWTLLASYLTTKGVRDNNVGSETALVYTTQEYINERAINYR